MELNEQNLNELLGLALTAVFNSHERDTTLGYKGSVKPLRSGLYFEGQGDDGQLYVLDNEHLARTGKLSFREYVTITDVNHDGIADVGGTDPGSETGGVKPVSKGVGGIGVGTLLTLLGIATGNPALGPASSTTEQAIGSLILGLLKGKLARHG